MRQLCERLNEWWRPDPPQRVRFEYEGRRILIRVNDTLAGLLFIQDGQPCLHLLKDRALTEGIEYYVSRVISASWNRMSLRLASKS